MLQNDAINTGFGVILAQTINGVEHDILIASRVLTDAEKTYFVTEKERLSVIWSIAKLRAYLEGYKITGVTNHSSLPWLNNLKNPTGRLARWALSLLEYNDKIRYLKVSTHHLTNAMSRLHASSLPC